MLTFFVHILFTKYLTYLHKIFTTIYYNDGITK